MRNGKLYPRPKSEPRTSGNASGFWRSPMAMDATGGLSTRPVWDGVRWGSKGSELLAQVHGLPWTTPMASQGLSGYTAEHDSRRRTSGGNRRGHEGNELLRQIHGRLWPTPLATDVSMSRRRKAKDVTLTDAARGGSGTTPEKSAGGKPHPEFHCWLMGWPTRWTSLEPLETARFREWLSRHGVG